MKRIVCLALAVLLVAVYGWFTVKEKVSSTGEEAGNTEDETGESEDPTVQATPEPADFSDPYYDGIQALRCTTEGVDYYELISEDTLNCASSPVPMVIMFHGLGGYRENMLNYAVAVAKLGYAVIVPQMADNQSEDDSTCVDFPDMIQNTALEVDVIRKAYADSKIVNPYCFALMGFSLGSMVSFYYAAYSDMPPACIISMCGTPDFRSVLNTAAPMVVIQNGIIRSADDEQRQQIVFKLVSNNPINNISNILRSQILMLNGEADEIMPVSSVRAFEQEALALGAEISVNIKAGRDHEWDAEYDTPKITAFLQDKMPLPDKLPENGTVEIEPEPERDDTRGS